MLPVVLLTIASLLIVSKAGGQTSETADINFYPGAIWPDNNGVHINAHGGGILFQNGAYYWFGEHKIEGKKGNSAQVGIHCYSSRDLYHWKDEGIALKVSDDAKSDIARGSIIERPKVVYNSRTKQYVMWFHLELLGKGYGSALAGIATSSKVTGPYQYLKSFRANPGKMPFYPVGTPESEKANCSDTVTNANKFFCRDMSPGQMGRLTTYFHPKRTTPCKLLNLMMIIQAILENLYGFISATKQKPRPCLKETENIIC